MLFHSYTGYGVDRRALRLMQWGIGMFLIAVPIDILNHRINGLDITSWSPSHALLYLGTAIMLAGAIRGWWLYAAAGRIRDLVSLGLWLFFVENVLFPNQHQEYGVLSVRAFDDGRTTAEPQLLDFAASQGASPLEFALPVPSWVHPAWLICAGLLALVVARKVVGLRWTATIIAATYLAYRAVMWLGLVAMGFPPSVLPVVLLVGAVLVDLAVTRRVPGWVAGPLVAAAVYGVGCRAGGPRSAAALELVVGAAGRGGLRPAVGGDGPARPQRLAGPLEGRRRAGVRGTLPCRPDPGGPARKPAPAAG